MLGYSAERVSVANCAVQHQARLTSLCKHDVEFTYCYALRPVFGGCCAISCEGCPAWISLATRERSRAGSLCALLQLYVVLTRVAERILALLPLMASGNVTEDACRDALRLVTSLGRCSARPVPAAVSVCMAGPQKCAMLALCCMTAAGFWLLFWPCLVAVQR